MSFMLSENFFVMSKLWQGTPNRLSENWIQFLPPPISRILDEKHDKHERIVKLSRDITIESKRVIFLLHRINW